MIRVLLIDDSPLALHVMQRFVAQAPDIQVVGTAAHGREALPMVAALAPDVICLDLNMPVMSGLEFTRQVMATMPRPILVVSVAVEPGMPDVFNLLQAGAVDVLPKPAAIETNDGKLAAELIAKIRLVAGVKVFRRSAGAVPPRPAPIAVSISPPSVAPAPASVRKAPLPHRTPARLVAMGASTGGPEAYRRILGDLPAGFPLPIVCVQHIGREFLAGLVAWLQQGTRLAVAQASPGESPRAGTVYFAPPDVHLDFDNAGRFVLARQGLIQGHCPSASVTLEAAARVYGSGAVGVLLTGMGQDGATGLAAIRRAGGETIVQDEESCVVYGMPGAAVALGAARQVLPLGLIPRALVSLAGGNTPAAADGGQKSHGLPGKDRQWKKG